MELSLLSPLFPNTFVTETFLSKPQPAVQIQSQRDKLLTEWQGRVLKYIPQRVTSIPAHFHSGLTLNSRNKGLKRFLDGFPKPGVCYVIRLKEMKHIPKGPDCVTLYLEYTYTHTHKKIHSGFQLTGKAFVKPATKSCSEPTRSPSGIRLVSYQMVTS